MKRIFTSTSVANLFGTGLRGFTDGNAITGIAPTRLNAAWFNGVQESIARTIESNGATVPVEADPENHWQLDDAVGRQFAMSTVDTGGVLHGLRFTEVSVLVIQITPGALHFQGRRYVITAAKISAANGDEIDLAPDRDNWIYATPDPGEPGVPDRGVVYFDRTAVTVGDPEPGSGTNYFPIMRLTTDADSITGVVYLNQGPKILTDNNSGLWFRRPDSGAARTDILPIGTVALGVREHPEYTAEAQRLLGAPIESVAAQFRYLRSTFSSLAPGAWLMETTIHGSTSGGGSSNVAILSSSRYPNGTVADVKMRGVAQNIDNPANSYTFERTCAVTRTGGVWTLDGTGTPDPYREHGTNAILDGVTVNNNVSGSNLRAAFTGHTTDALRWFAYVSTVITTPPA